MSEDFLNKIFALFRPRNFGVYLIVIGSSLTIMLGIAVGLVFLSMPPMPGATPTFLIAVDPLLALLGALFLAGAAFLVLGGAVMIRKDQTHWQRGARYPARSLEEAWIHLNLTDSERRAYQAMLARSTIVKPLLVTLPLLLHAAALSLFWDRLPDKLWLWSAIALPFYLWPFLDKTSMREQAVTFLASTRYATENGITSDDLNQPWHKAFKGNSYYREAIPELDTSPFEEEG